MKSIDWLAGLLEGEGWFGLHKTKRGHTRQGHPQGPYAYPNIKLAMGDRDVVEQVAEFWNSHIIVAHDPRPNHNPMFVTWQHGVSALVTMLAVYPLMGNRRRQKIEFILSAWEHN